MIKSGWIIEEEKSDKSEETNQIKEKRGVLQQVTKTIEYESNPVAAKGLAGTLGKIVATEPAFGLFVIMASRAAYSDLDTAVINKE